MKHTGIRMLGLLLVLCTLIFSGKAYADTAPGQTLSEGDFEYVLTENGTAEITGYTGKAVFLTVPDTLGGYEVTSLGQWAFTACDSLRTVKLPDSLQTVKGNPFAGCRRLQKLRVSEKHKTLKIKDGILYHKKDKRLICCPPVGVTSAEVMSGTKEISDYAFFRCRALSSIAFPDSLEKISVSAFKQCTALAEISFAEGLEEIGDAAFEDCMMLTELVLPDGVRSLGRDAFRNCTGLHLVSLPESLTASVGNPFAGCTGLSEIHVPEENEYFRVLDQALVCMDDETLVCFPAGAEQTEYQIPAEVHKIGEEAFFRAMRLNLVSLNAEAQEIGISAFSGCTALTAVSLPEGLKKIDDYAFECCESLSKITLPEGLTEIGRDTFSMCGSLSEITLPEGLTSLGEDAFSFCGRLERVSIPDSLTELPVNPFIYCPNLKEIRVSAAHPVFSVIGHALFDMPRKTLVCYPAGLGNCFYQVPRGTDRIGAYAFYNCRSLRYVSLNTAATEIDAYAFAYCEDLQGMNLPERLAELGPNAFLNCGDVVFTVGKGAGAAKLLGELGLAYEYEELKETDPMLLPY